MFCDLCERSSRFIVDERDCFEHLLDRVREHHRDLQLRLRKTSVEMEELKCDNDSLRRENETLRAAYAGQRQKETQEECTPKKFRDPHSGFSQDREPFEESEEQILKLPVRAKTTTKAGGWLSKKDILNETITSKKVLTFDKPPALVKYLMDAPKIHSRISTAAPDVSQKKEKLRQTTLTAYAGQQLKETQECTPKKVRVPYSGSEPLLPDDDWEIFRSSQGSASGGVVDKEDSPINNWQPEKKSHYSPDLFEASPNEDQDSDATFCEELVNATPEKHAPSWRLRERISRPFGRFDTPPVLKKSRNGNNPEKPKARKKKVKKPPENPQALHTFVTPDGFWDLGFPPPAKTQPPSPNDPLAKRPKP